MILLRQMVPTCCDGCKWLVFQVFRQSVNSERNKNNGLRTLHEQTNACLDHAAKPENTYHTPAKELLVSASAALKSCCSRRLRSLLKSKPCQPLPGDGMQDRRTFRSASDRFMMLYSFRVCPSMQPYVKPQHIHSFDLCVCVLPHHSHHIQACPIMSNQDKEVTKSIQWRCAV